MPVTVVTHPLAQHYLTILRDKTTPTPTFRETARRMAYLLVTEATSDMPMAEKPIETPLEATIGAALGRPIVVVAVFRAGLGLLDAAIDLIPNARIGYAGVQRNEETAEPMAYYSKFPKMTDARVLILEPMLATGGSLAWACDQVKENGANDITAVCVVSAPAGIDVMNQRHPDVRVVTASIDRGLNESFYIEPGLGDMGDRLFGTA